MASRWVSHWLILVPPEDDRLGTSRAFVDHAEAVRTIRDTVGFSKATIKFTAKGHRLEIAVDPRTGKWGCPRIGTIKVSTMEPKQQKEMTWARAGEITWVRHGPSRRDRMEQLVDVIKDAIIMGTFEFANVKPCVAPFLAKALCQTQLTVLKITRSTVFSEEVAKMLAHLLLNCKTLERLELSSCNFSNASPESVLLVADALKRSRLQSFRFGTHSCYRGSLALALLLGKGLVGHKTLKSLCFSGHTFHTVDAVAVQALLSADNCMVKKLYIDGCFDVGPESTGGAVSIVDAVAAALTVNQTVMLLDLSDTKVVSDKQMEALAGVLSKNTVLDELYMENSGISEVGIIAFALVLPKMTRLRKLDLKRNGCGQKACDALRSSLEKGNFGLHVLEFEKQDFRAASVCCTPPSYFYGCDEHCRLAIECQLALNGGGRALLGKQDGGKKNVPSSLWPHVFERAQTVGTFSNDIVFNLLRAQAVAFGPGKV
ncbi:Leucine-rich repeat protein [Seminavis robusta]|uniref:Leucine-rich repeat protein n=1 Tax=Seminavis robusta TaxID=568900 RepID=A0A9N8E4S9_9STRA|nr:Leucine-rich repeat protein [Seminavis robusta]|eukprot:Sro619_g176500.1 Leucine-rich repeat protein (486) ;mRNA; f:44613-46070